MTTNGTSGHWQSGRVSRALKLAASITSACWPGMSGACTSPSSARSLQRTPQRCSSWDSDRRSADDSATTVICWSSRHSGGVGRTFAGRVKQKLAPRPSEPVKVSSPPSSSTSWRLICRPLSPPVGMFSSCVRVCSSRPQPLSLISKLSNTVPVRLSRSRVLTLMSTCPWSVKRRALLTRLVSTCLTRTSSVTISCGTRESIKQYSGTSLRRLATENRSITSDSMSSVCTGFWLSCRVPCWIAE